MEQLRGVVFDMDDTLYPESSYVESGFQAVARWLGGKGFASREAFDFLWGEFQHGRRGDTFDALLQAFPTLQAMVQVHQLVEIYREHFPTLSLFPEMESLLDRMKARGIPTALISDGPRTVQAKKVEALGLASKVDAIFLTDAWGREFWKPHPRAFQAAEQALGLRGECLAYIADNPTKDFQAPHSLGWRTLWATFPGRVHANLDAAPNPTAIAQTPREAVKQIEAWLQEHDRGCL